MECRVPTLHGKHRRASIVTSEVRQQHRDEDQHRRRGDTDERVGRANGTTAHLARFSHDGRLELVERRVRGSAELLGGSTELLARRRARRSVTRLTVLLLAGLRLAEGSPLALLRLAAKLRLTLLAEGGLLALLRLAAKLRLTLLRSSAVLGLAEGGLLSLRLSIGLGRVAEGRLRDLLLGRRGRGSLVTRGSLGLRRAVKDRLLEIVIRGRNNGSLGLCGSLNARLFDRGLLDRGLGRRGVSLGLRFLVGTGERLGLLAGLLRGSLELRDSRFHGSRGLRGNDALIRQPLPEGRVQRRVRCDVRTQVRASGSNIREILGRKRRIAQVGSGELRRIDSAHLYSSRTRRCSS